MTATQRCCDCRSLLIVAGLILAVLLSAWVTSGDPRSRAVPSIPRAPTQPEPGRWRRSSATRGSPSTWSAATRRSRDIDLDGAAVLITSADHLGRSTILRVIQTADSYPVIVVDARSRT